MRLLRVAVVLVVLFVAAELLAPTFVANRAESLIEEKSDDRLQVAVTVSGPPLLWPVLTEGTVDSFEVEVQEVAGTALPVEATLRFEQVRLSRSELLGGRVEIVRTGRGEAVVVVDLSDRVPESLEPILDRLEGLGLDELLAELGDRTIEFGGQELVLSSLQIPVGRCRTEVANRVVTARCELEEFPPFMVDAITSVRSLLAD